MAACHQMLGQYDDAILCYGFASLINLEDPLPIFHSIECYIALKKNSDALSALEALLTLTNNKPEFDHLKNWAMKMKEVLS